MKPVHRTLLAILLVAAILRMIGLDSRGIWYDDAFSILLSQQSPAMIVAGTSADTMPPLYYFLLHFWMLFGQSLGWIRLLNVLFSLLTVWLLYRMVAGLASPRAGLWAAALAAIAPFQIYHAQELRSYALLGFCELSYFYFFSRLWLCPAPGRRWHWIGLILAGAAAIWSHNLAVFALVVPNLFILWMRRWRILPRLLAAQAVIALLALPWLILLPGQIQNIQGAFSIPRPGLTEVIQSLIIFTSNLPLPILLLPVGLFVSLLGMVLIIFEIVREPGHGRGLGLLTWFVLAPPVLMLIASYLMQPVFVTRGFIISALAYNGIAGYVIARRWPAVGILVGSVFLVGALIALPYQIQYTEFPRSPFRQAASALELAARPGDRIIHDNKLSQFPMRVYTPGLPQQYLADRPGTENDTLATLTQQATGQLADRDIISAVGNAGRVYFVVFNRTFAEYALLGAPEHPNLAWLRQQFRQTDRQVFGDLEVYRFER